MTDEELIAALRKASDISKTEERHWTSEVTYAAADRLEQLTSQASELQQRIDGALGAITVALDGPTMTIDGRAAVEGVLNALTRPLSVSTPETEKQ